MRRRFDGILKTNSPLKSAVAAGEFKSGRPPNTRHGQTIAPLFPAAPSISTRVGRHGFVTKTQTSPRRFQGISCSPEKFGACSEG
jgi:hypothetical protein